MPGRGRGWAHWHRKDGGGDDDSLPVNEFRSSVEIKVSPAVPSDGKRVKDSERLLSIFPEEVWTQIFDSVADPNDLESLSNSTPFFRQLLLPKRVQFLFPKVWALALGTKYERELDTAYLDCDTLIDTEDPSWNPAEDRHGPDAIRRTRLYSESKWFSVITKLRLVCKTWCSAVDTFYQNWGDDYKLSEPDDKFPDSSDPKPFELGVGDWTRVTFWEYDVDYLKRFLEHFEKTHVDVTGTGRNPFVGRNVGFESCLSDDDDYENFQEFSAGIDRFLAKYGGHIWYCGIHVHDRFPSNDSIGYYMKIREWMGLLPNVKVLHVSYSRWSMGHSL